MPVGKTKDAGWEIGVSRTFPCTVEHAWSVVTGDGLGLWLGAHSLPGERGEPYETADGVRGELRSLRPLDRVRLTWQPPSWSHDSTVQVAVSRSPSGKTVVRFHQERMAGPEEREAQRAHWSAALDRLTPLLT